MEIRTGRGITKWFVLCLLVSLGLWACKGETFDINGDWEIIVSQDGSEWGYDRSRASVWTFSGSAFEGEITADVSFLSGTYRIEGKSVAMEVVAGRGPMWFRRRFSGYITGNGSMQGIYEGESVPLGPEEPETFSGSWWAIKKR